VRIGLILLACLILFAGCGGAPEPETQTPEGARSMASFAAFKDQLITATDLQDSVARAEAVDALWKSLDRIPFVAGGQVAFLYRGPANHVSFAGDFTGWSPDAAVARRMGNSDVWLREETFPADARLDYKVVVDGNWILDPANPAIQRSGFGDNSELAMPGYVPSPWAERRPEVPRGDLTPGTLSSPALGYAVDYLVYTPVGFAEMSALPVIYVTDGHEYAHDVMGSLVAVMDNLIAAGKLRPMMAVFMDPRVGGRNLRSEQYILNERFVEFVARDLVPVIDAAYPTSPDRADRGILGTSLGGLNSAFFALKATDTFQRIAIQSPAYHAGDGKIIGLFQKAPRLDVDIYMTWGTFNDFGETTDRFQRILDKKGYDYRFKVVNEGHSWGNWRALVDDILLAFWPAL